MSTTIPFGAGQISKVALGHHTVLAPDAARFHPVSDPAAAMRAALATPQGFPAVTSAVVPGDRVTVAIGRPIPHVARVLQGTIESLGAAGVQPQDIIVLSADRLKDSEPEFDALRTAGVQFQVHDPDDEAAIAMLGTTAAHRPLRLNRTLTDADFVLPIDAARPAPSGVTPEKFGGLFPRFSNRETAARLGARGKAARPAAQAARVAESDEAGWMLGVGVAAVVVPGPGAGVSAILAGDPRVATVRADAMCQEIWVRPLAERGDLVIGAIPGDATEQTWSNLARAVAACRRVATPGGAVAICSELGDPPAGAFESLIDAMDFGAVAHKLHDEAAADARPASVLAKAIDRGPVFLRSRLPAETVESLGMTPFSNDAELSRLAGGRRHVVVIEEAQRLKPRLAGDANGVD